MAVSYPVTRYAPSAFVDLSARAERERLSPSAIKGFFNIMMRWKVRDEDARALTAFLTSQKGGGKQEAAKK